MKLKEYINTNLIKPRLLKKLKIQLRVINDNTITGKFKENGIVVKKLLKIKNIIKQTCNS